MKTVKTCAHCGKTFGAKYPWHLYCCQKCRDAECYLRHREDRIERAKKYNALHREEINEWRRALYRVKKAVRHGDS